MKMLSMVLVLVALLFAGCGLDDSKGDGTSRTDAPQPDVADESLRPPKPPSI